MKRFLKIAALVVLVIVVAIGALAYSAFGNRAPIPAGLRVNRVEVVKDGIVSVYLIELAPGTVALVDAGNDENAAAVRAALGARNLGPEAVTTILLTHGDGDHVHGAHAFPHATVYALAADIGLAEGRAARGPFRSPHPNGLHVTALADGQVLDISGIRVEVFAVPGHTPGSAAFLIDGVLFLGDSADVASDGRLEPGNWLFSSDRPTNRASLRDLAKRLSMRAGDIRAIACSHSGVLTQSLTPLSDLSARLSQQ
jgi:hydroxyacylglutathione hydrolase